MALVVTDAVVLHVFDYLESSRIFRLATREAGVQSVIARGARRSRSRYGSALDLFAGGVASIHTREGRELQTLGSFEVTSSRTSIAASLERFTAASALAELMLRFAADDAQASLFETLVGALDAVGAAPSDLTCDVAIGAAWHIVSELGFAPTIDACASCHTLVPPEDAARFSHPAGGVLCARCVASVPSSRTVPSSARDALRTWLGGGEVALDGEGARRAHQRLLREFLQEHLADGRPLVAYDVWERDGWSAPAVQRAERA
jgi:DNA repair protein RecO (recombination protein O)